MDEMQSYTKEARQRSFDLIEAEPDAVWAGIGSMPEDTDAKRWEKKLQSIAAEYMRSPRFSLMRILAERAGAGHLIAGGEQEEKPEKDSFTVNVKGKKLVFADISMEHAEHLTDRELQDYELLLRDIASRQQESDPEQDCQLIERVFGMKQKKKLQLSREDAFAIGHVLGFSVEEMQGFLWRTLDTGDGFRYQSSNDLIELYCFIKQKGSKAAAALKEEYRNQFASVKKVDCEEKAADWTQNIRTSLPEEAALWPAETSDRQFMDWMKEKAPYLDLGSRTALRIYRNLAVYAYNLAKGEESSPIESDLVQVIREITAEKEEDSLTVKALYEEKTDAGQTGKKQTRMQISEKKCGKVAELLLHENQNLSLSEEKDSTHSWHVPTTKKNGEVTVNGGINAERSRVKKILIGEENVEKSDLQYLLWFIANLCWFDNGSDMRNSEIYDRLTDFIDASDVCLNAAMLPAFYPPHLMEQTMMLAIVCGGKQKDDPAEVYETICRAQVEHRNRRTKKEKSQKTNPKGKNTRNKESKKSNSKSKSKSKQ